MRIDDNSGLDLVVIMRLLMQKLGSAFHAEGRAGQTGPCNWIDIECEAIVNAIDHIRAIPVLVIAN